MRRPLAALAWFAVVVVIALGAAGIVTGMDRSGVDAPRPELTMRGDGEVVPVLDAAEGELRLLADDVAALGVVARRALASLNGTDLEDVEAAIAEGDVLVAAILARSGEIDRTLSDIPLLASPEAAYQVSQAVRDRHEDLSDATEATTALDAAWVRLTTGSLAASRLSALLAAHDEAILRAAEQGRNADYDDAVETVDTAAAAITEARAVRDRLAATVDVTVLDQWLDRNADYDTALRGLYEALQDVRGRVTAKVRDAIEAERAAKDRLPPDSRGLIVIMAEIGRGGMNSAVIAIEEARGRLAEALEAPPEPGASSAPAP